MRTQIYILTLFVVVVTCQQLPGQGIFFRSLVSNLRSVPIVGNLFKASVDPLYRPLFNVLPSSGIQSREGEESDECFGEIGCLVTPSEFYHPIYRPINFPASTRDQINVTYKVHTRQIPHGTIVPALELKERFNRSSFNPTRDTKIIIHGFLDTSTATWLVGMLRAFLQYGDLNVITVDWSGGSRALYTQATANIRVVGLEVAHLVNWLRKAHGVDPANVHIIGHSLGAHTSGYAGERIPGLGRITGLDPAEPYFQHMGPLVRLDPSDANFVDVIHTDAASIFNTVLALGLLGDNGYGMDEPVGHIDFYPNEGRSQPGCNTFSRLPLTALSDGIDFMEGLDAAQKELITCSHVRAPKLFTDSILSQCPFTAFQCDSFEKYAEGLCMDCGVNKTNCAPMGLHADKWQDKERENVKMFLSTSEGPTYCSYHYRLDLAFSDPENTGDSLRGRLKISFISEDGALKDFDLTPNSPVIFKKGSSLSFSLTHPDDLTGSKQALISWTYAPDYFSPMSYCVSPFCSSDLQITALALTSFDSKAERIWNPVARIGKIEEIIMCHTLGDRIINIPSEDTVNVAASKSCPDILTKINQQFKNDVPIAPSENDIIWEVEREWPRHLQSWDPLKPLKTWSNKMKMNVVTKVKGWMPFTISRILYDRSHSGKPAYHYVLKLTFNDPRTEGNKHISGEFNLSFLRPDGKVAIIDLTKSSTVSFPRRGSITFYIINKHRAPMEDLTQIKDVLVTWIFQPNVLNPLSYCAWNCKTELHLETLTLTSYNAKIKRKKHVSKRKDSIASITMCGVGLEKISTLTSYQSLRLRASENCTAPLETDNTTEKITDQSRFDEFIDHTYSFIDIIDKAKMIRKTRENNENAHEGHIENDISIVNEDSRNKKHGYFEFFLSKFVF